MLKGIYTSAYGMFTRMAQNNVISNNIANSNTTGYKKDVVVFKSLLQEGKKENLLETMNNEDVEVLAVYPRYEQGPLRQTNNPLDLAISGDGFFVVNTQNGDRFTRAGDFTINQNNILVDMNNNPVLGQNGPIQIIGNEVTITKDGTVIVDGNTVDTLRLVKFDNPENLLKEGHNYFMLNQGQQIIEMLPNERNILAGFIENSNVNAVQEMVYMIEAMRLYETNQKAIQMQDGTLDKLINEVARA